MAEPLNPADREAAAAKAAAADAATEQRDRELGGELILRLHGVLRGMRLYDATNRALRQRIQDLHDAVSVMGTDDVSLLGMGEYFYVNGVRLRPDGSQLPVFRNLLGEFDVRGLGGLRFSPGLSIEELESFLRIFHANRAEGAAAKLESECTKAGVRNVCAIRARVAGLQGPVESADSEADRARQRPRMVFRRALSGTRELMMRTARTGRPALQQARRVVQPIVDQLLQAEHSLVGLTALKRHDEYTYAHCVNVSILSIRMGQLLGLSRAELASIGVAALLHDTGKIAVPAEVLRKPGKLEPDEWDAIRRHPIEGLRIVSRLPGVSNLMLDSMRVAFEHHMNVDHSGYPGVRMARDMAPFSRIVAVADIFDAVTSHRAYRKRPMTAHEALRLLLGREREHFDRAVLWSLLQTVGLYPAGTMMQTESGRLWLSVAPNAADLRRPVSRELLVGPDGEAAPLSTDAPLPEDERVMRVLAPEDVEVDVESLLAA